MSSPWTVQYYQKVLALDPGAYWMFDESAGIVAHDSTRSSWVTENLLASGGFEYPSTFTTFGGWTDRVGTGAIASEGAIVHGGAAACKLTYGADPNTWVYADVSVVPGDSLALAFWARGDGSVAGRYGVYDVTNAAFIIGFTSTGVTAAAYSEVTDTVAVPATCNVVRLYFACSTGAGDVYFDDASLIGQGTLDAAYTGGSGVTLGASGVGDGRTGASFDGVDTSVYIGGNRFNSVWNGDAGSAAVWGKMDAAAWADTASNRYLLHAKSLNDAHYYVAFGKADVADRLIWLRKVGNGKATNEQVYNFGTPPSDQWFFQGYTWDIAVPRLRGYLYVPSVLSFTEVFNIAGTDMDAWGDHPVNDTNCVAMAESPVSKEFLGPGAHIAVWDRALSFAEMQSLAIVQ